MLTRVGAEVSDKGARVDFKDASFPSPFVSGLEYGCSARGTWNIVHTGMLLPQGHEIFVCAAGCLRGVVLTAAEMNATDRFSTVEIREQNILDGDMEELIIEGVSDILSKLAVMPKAVLVYTSCVHHFIGCDLPLVYRELRKRFPQVDFTDCYMNPIMRKSGLTPDQLMRRQLYSLLKEREQDKKQISIIGNNIGIDKGSEIYSLSQKAGFKVIEITDCKSYDEYQTMAGSCVNIVTNPVAIPSGKELEKRLSQKLLSMPLSYGFDKIEKALDELCEYMGLPKQDFSEKRKACEKALSDTLSLVGNTPITIDYTATTAPLSLTRMLLDRGFNVTSVYADSFNALEKEDFDYIKKSYPTLSLYATVHAKLRVLPRASEGKTLAIGQKAAYFTGTEHFVNIVEGGGMYGFDGIVKLCALVREAYMSPKDTKSLIQIKGLGCGCV